eukprot:754403-Hanusia_phi.AAC.4
MAPLSTASHLQEDSLPTLKAKPRRSVTFEEGGGGTNPDQGAGYFSAWRGSKLKPNVSQPRLHRSGKNADASDSLERLGKRDKFKDKLAMYEKLQAELKDRIEVFSDKKPPAVAEDDDKRTRVTGEEEEDESRPSARPRRTEENPSEPPALSSKAAQLSDRLAALDKTVFDHRLSLAGTSSRSQADLTNTAANTSRDAVEDGRTVWNDDERDVLADKGGGRGRLRLSLKVPRCCSSCSGRALVPDTRIFKLCRGKQPLTLKGGDSEGLHDTVISAHLETEGEWPGNQFLQRLTDAVRGIDRKFDLPEQHLLADLSDSAEPFLLDISRSVQYNPVLTWYAVDRDDEPHGGSVGRLARLDPVSEQEGGVSG